MKVKNFSLLSYVIIVIIFFSLQTNADIYYETFKFADVIAPGASFEWNVDTLEYGAEGDEDYVYYNPENFLEYMKLGNHSLVEGSKIRIEVIEDPDNYTSSDTNVSLFLTPWYKVYLDETEVTDEIGESFLGVPLMGFFGLSTPTGALSLIYPILYINETGTYDLLEMLYNEYKENEESWTDNNSEVSEGYTYEYKETQEFKVDLAEKQLTLKLRNYLYAYMEDNDGTLLEGELDMKASMSISRDDGRVIEASFWYDFWVDMEYPGEPIENSKSYLHYQLLAEDHNDYGIKPGDNGTITIPFNWVNSLLGTTLLSALVLVLRKRK